MREGGEGRKREKEREREGGGERGRERERGGRERERMIRGCVACWGWTDRCDLIQVKGKQVFSSFTYLSDTWVVSLNNETLHPVPLTRRTHWCGRCVLSL